MDRVIVIQPPSLVETIALATWIIGRMDLPGAHITQRVFAGLPRKTGPIIKTRHEWLPLQLDLVPIGSATAEAYIENPQRRARVGSEQWTNTFNNGTTNSE